MWRSECAQLCFRSTVTAHPSWETGELGDVEEEDVVNSGSKLLLRCGERYTGQPLPSNCDVNTSIQPNLPVLFKCKALLLLLYFFLFFCPLSFLPVYLPQHCRGFSQTFHFPFFCAFLWGDAWRTGGRVYYQGGGLLKEGDLPGE